jgi:hypothetical protein
MDNQRNDSTLDPDLPDHAVEAEVLSRVISAMQELDKGARERLLETVATFFGMSSRVTMGPRLPSAVVGRSTASFSEDRSQSPKEFLFAKKPVTDIERIACLAFYLTHYRDTPHFKTLDLSKLNTEAAQIKFSNAAQAVDNATKSGLLVAATKGNKQISALGELYVQALPDRVAARDAIAGARPRRRLRGKQHGTSDIAE